MSLLLSVPCIAQNQVAEFSEVALKMGSRFELIAISDDSTAAHKAITAGYREIDRIEQLISSWLPQSQTSKINSNAGQSPVQIDRELFDLIHRSIKVSQLTNGAFDISYAGLNIIWNFNQQQVESLPDSGQVAEAVKNVNYKNILLDHGSLSVVLKMPEMKIGFGSIGKGYAANRAKTIMQQMGISSGMVNAGGDLITWGPNAEGAPWTIGIADPTVPGNIMAWLTLEETALVTSGDYENYFLYQDKKYSHILDPRTGYPITGIKSVSILCPDAELADALATAVFVLGAKEGMDLINELNQVEGLIIDDKNRLLESDNLILNYYSPK